MKKKKVFMAFITIVSVVCGTLTRISAYADSNPVKSRGNFVLDNGAMSIYASDVDYLQSEVTGLYDELPSIIGGDASAAGPIRRDSIRSKGIIDYSNGKVVLDSSDFTYLADEIDDLEIEYKANSVEALNGIGTYFKLDGSITHNQEEENLSSQYAAGLSFNAIYQGILESQSVAHLSDVQAEDSEGKLLYYADQSASESHNLIMTTTNANDFPILIQPATEANLTAGTAAWVDGKLIIGNGADNKAYYDKVESILYGAKATPYNISWNASSQLSATVTSPTGSGSSSQTITGASGPIYIRYTPNNKSAYITSLSFNSTFSYTSGGNYNGTYFTLYIYNPSNNVIATKSMPITNGTLTHKISLFDYDISKYDYFYIKYTIYIQANGYISSDDGGIEWSSTTSTSMENNIQLSYLLVE